MVLNQMLLGFQIEVTGVWLFLHRDRPRDRQHSTEERLGAVDWSGDTVQGGYISVPV